MRIHAIIIALNEEDFIAETLKTLYPFCSGISVITQYDRDYYGKLVAPDETVNKILSFPDPEGKLHLVVRRFNDETASRNHEMNAILFDGSKGITSHGVPLDKVKNFHERPDYFLVCDADEIYDIDTLPTIVEYLGKKKPRGMRVSAYDYYFDWNHRVAAKSYVHHQFGFVKAGVMFEQQRIVTWNEYRLNKVLKLLRLPIQASCLWNFIDCPWEVGMFHHAGYVRRDKVKMQEKLNKHSHLENHKNGYLEEVLARDLEFVPTCKLPGNIKDGNWPPSFFHNNY